MQPLRIKGENPQAWYVYNIFSTLVIILSILVYCCIVGIFYFMLANIDPKFRSSLHTIQLVAVVRTEMIEKYPISEILEPFISDIRQLESVRITPIRIYVILTDTCMCMVLCGVLLLDLNSTMHMHHQV